MENQYRVVHNLLTYSCLIFLAAFFGGMIPIFLHRWREDTLKYFVSAGAGLLLGMTFLHMLPEAAEMLPHSFGAWFLLGFLILFVLERFVMVHACEEHGCDYHTIGIAAFLGLATHGVIEGFALASSELATTIGPLVLIGILSHKVPAGMTLTSLLKMSEKRFEQIVLFNIGVALSGPIGIWLAFMLIQTESIQASAGVLLAVSSGTFLYIAACDLLPQLHVDEKGRLLRFVSFLLGLAVSVVGAFVRHP